MPDSLVREVGIQLEHNFHLIGISSQLMNVISCLCPMPGGEIVNISLLDPHSRKEGAIQPVVIKVTFMCFLILYKLCRKMLSAVSYSSTGIESLFIESQIELWAIVLLIYVYMNSSSCPTSSRPDVRSKTTLE